MNKSLRPIHLLWRALFTKLTIHTHNTLGIQQTNQSSDIAVSIESVDRSSSDPEDALEVNFYYYIFDEVRAKGLA